MQEKRIRIGKLLTCCCLLFIPLILFAQDRKVVTGKVMNRFTQEPLAFATVYWKAAGFGILADSIGHFSLKNSSKPGDTLVISYVGYENRKLVFADNEKRTELEILMETATKEGVVIKSKYNKGLLWWKNIVAHKHENAPGHYDSYYSELYNKLEIDLANLDKSRLEKNPLLKPFMFVLDKVDSISEQDPFLPVFLTESLSDYYVSHRPEKVREEIKALQTSGIRNESVMEYMGGIHQKINTYNDYMNVFGREFISPVSSVGDRYYNYKGLDTQIINGDPYYHLRFTPKHEGDNLFSGDCWVHSTTWALQKISLAVDGAVNMNFVKRLGIVQEFALLNGKEWVVTKDKFIVELAPFGRNKTSFIGRKTTLYQKVKVNEPFITDKLNNNRKKEETVMLNDASAQTNTWWDLQRPESLSVNEQKAMQLVDTLRALPAFKKLSNTFSFLVDGHKKFGAIEIGPWYKWVSRNTLEGLRFRFDVGTTERFSKDLRLYAYLAYGVKDKAWKGKIGASWNLPGDNGWNIQPSYKHDLDNRQRGFNGEEVSLDNIFSQIIRRPNIPQKFVREDEVRLAVTKTFPNSLSIQASAARSDYETFDPLPKRKWFTPSGTNDFINTEFQMKFRYAPGERTLRTHRKVRRIRSNQPVTELIYAFAPEGVMGSQYVYQKVNISVNQRFRLPRWGQVTYMAYAGKIFGNQVPFMLLQMHPGNEHYYYNKDAFSLMNKYEFFSDQYAGFNIEHNFEKKLLNLLPFMRRTNMRQFWNMKTVIGDLSPSNKAFNRFEAMGYGMHSLKGHLYTEVGTGIDNIFKFFRVDAVWRFSPDAKSMATAQNFGVFGSFRIQF